MPPYSIQQTCDFLYIYSKRTWDRINFVRKLKGRVSETTITENLLFDFWHEAAFKSLPVILYEAKNEKANGNDLEIFVETGKGYFLVACQAKIVNAKHRYASIFHKVGSDYQINLLIKYAEKFGGFPAYLLYNYVPLFLQNVAFQAVSDERQYGITVCGAVPISMMMDLMELFGKKMPVPSFNDFHPHFAVPIHRFICDL